MPESDLETCSKCGGIMVEDGAGITHHLNEDGEIDYDMDINHVAFSYPDENTPFALRNSPSDEGILSPESNSKEVKEFRGEGQH